MARRWIIRIIFMLPILLCVGGWGWSAMYLTGAGYKHDGSYVGCGSGRGAVSVLVARNTRGRDGWNAQFYPLVHTAFWPNNEDWQYAHFLGFGWHDWRANGPKAESSLGIAVPFYFLIAVSSAVLIVVWRKTRPKINPKMSFPVEVNKTA